MGHKMNESDVTILSFLGCWNWNAYTLKACFSTTKKKKTKKLVNNFIYIVLVLFSLHLIC